MANSKWIRHDGELQQYALNAGVGGQPYQD